MVSDPESPHAKAYRAIADRVWEKLSRQLAPGAARPAPKIVVQ